MTKDEMIVILTIILSSVICLIGLTIWDPDFFEKIKFIHTIPLIILGIFLLIVWMDSR